jgi:hypothetical protein
VLQTLSLQPTHPRTNIPTTKVCYRCTIPMKHATTILGCPRSLYLIDLSAVDLQIYHVLQLLPPYERLPFRQLYLRLSTPSGLKVEFISTTTCFSKYLENVHGPILFELDFLFFFNTEWHAVSPVASNVWLWLSPLSLLHLTTYHNLKEQENGMFSSLRITICL